MEYLVDRRNFCLFYILTAAGAVYIFANWDAIINPYVINDDTRQQIYWMEMWRQQGLFRDGLLTRYAINYVPWGVQALYALAAPFVSPLQFTKVVAGILYVATAGFLFGIGLQFRDNLAAVYIAIVSLLSYSFMDKISGGLSQSFGLPLLAGYLFFLGRGNLVAAGIMILLQSVFNPYIFVLCLLTHVIYLTYNFGRDGVELLRSRAGKGNPPGGRDRNKRSVEPVPGENDRKHTVESGPRDLHLSWKLLLSATVPVMLGIFLMALKYVVLEPPEFGEIVTWADMAGKIEYTAAGRYEILPIPSLWDELMRPWAANWGQPAWWIGLITLIPLALLTWKIVAKEIDGSGFLVFAYMAPASLLMYGLSYVFLMKLFLPRRYIEFPQHIFYAVVFGLCLLVLSRRLVSRRVAFPLVTTLLIIGAALKVYHVGIYDYSAQDGLYRFLRTTPLTSLVAGPPDLMDNVHTFGQRKAFITYELSHTWYKKYWAIIKERTFDFFRAYYSEDPDEVRRFCRENGIDYLVVQDEDFQPERLKKGDIYFEPFGSYVRDYVGSRSRFAVLDKKQFPPVYHMDGVRVLTPLAPP